MERERRLAGWEGRDDGWSEMGKKRGEREVEIEEREDREERRKREVESEEGRERWRSRKERRGGE